MDEKTKQEILSRNLALTGEQIAEAAMRRPAALGRAIVQSNCDRRAIRQAIRSAANELEIRKFEKAVKGAA